MKKAPKESEAPNFLSGVSQQPAESAPASIAVDVEKELADAFANLSSRIDAHCPASDWKDRALSVLQTCREFVAKSRK